MGQTSETLKRKKCRNDSFKAQWDGTDGPALTSVSSGVFHPTARPNSPKLLVVASDFTTADRGIGTVNSDIDALAYESNTGITQAEVTTARMPTGEGVVVRPVTDILWSLQHSVEWHGTGCGDGVWIVPPVPLAPARQSLTNRVSI